MSDWNQLNYLWTCQLGQRVIILTILSSPRDPATMSLGAPSAQSAFSRPFHLQWRGSTRDRQVRRHITIWHPWTREYIPQHDRDLWLQINHEEWQLHKRQIALQCIVHEWLESDNNKLFSFTLYIFVNCCPIRKQEISLKMSNVQANRQVKRRKTNETRQFCQTVINYVLM